MQGHAPEGIQRGLQYVLLVGNFPPKTSLHFILSPHAHPTDRTFCSSSAFKIKCGNYTQGNWLETPKKGLLLYCNEIATHLNSTLFYSLLLTNCDACGLLYITGGAKCWVATLASEKTGSAFVGAPVAVTSEDPWWGALATISIRLGNRPGCCCCCCCCCCCTR